jgi:hypothetical protein
VAAYVTHFLGMGIDHNETRLPMAWRVVVGSYNQDVKRRRKMTRKRRRRYTTAAVLLLVCLLLVWWYEERFGGPDVVARVLFAETANCTRHERLLVAGVMRNRVGNAAFGGLPSVKAVVLQEGAFSCINDSDNANWRESRHPAFMSSAERAVWEHCLEIAGGSIAPAFGPSGRPLVYYHDHSIGKPRSWDNQKWHAVREVVTEHFVFYSIVPAQ